MPTCDAVKVRKILTESLKHAAFYDGPDYGEDEITADGSEKALLDAWWRLEGIVAEYTDGGDQMAELCTCIKAGVPYDHDEAMSASLHRQAHAGETFAEVLEKHKAAPNS